MKELWQDTTRELALAPHFEVAARVVLRAVLDVCAAVLAPGSDDADRPGRMPTRAVRAMVHMRPDGDYRRIATLNVDGAPAAAYVPSATAWRWVCELRDAVAIDVPLGLVEAHDGTGFRTVVEPGSEGTAWETRNRLLGRDVTHLLALPLRVPGGDPGGMISIEVEARSLVGSAIWSDEAVALLGLGDMAAAPLFSLPVAPAGATPCDELLPVVGGSMRATVEMLRVFAAQDETILLSGPTGVGKSRLARWCHEASGRRKAPFETLDLASVSEELQMAELFGWRKGAFTGAVTDNAGHIGRAEKGTLFIDEVDKLSYKAQAGLLRVLEERKYRPLGDGAADRLADVRFVVGTNVRLKERVRNGGFREDSALYRIHVLPVKVPSLAERLDEVVPWAEFMLRRKLRADAAEGQAVVSTGAARALSDATWPGNLRQLDNIIRRAYALLVLEHGAPTAQFVLEARHVERALAYEGETEEKSIVELLNAAATAFVLEAERAQREGRNLDLDLTAAFRGFVLAAAAHRLGKTEDAFRLFGEDSQVENRNHTKAFRKELAKVEELYAAVRAGKSPFGALLDRDAKRR